MNPIDYAFLAVAVLLLSTVLAGSLSSRFGLPAMIGFLALGMIAGSDGPFGIVFSDYAFAQVIGVACLVFILFSGGLDTNWKLVRPSVGPALVLSTIGVMISAGIVGLAAVFLLGFTVTQGFLLGAVVASTDAAAVFAIMRGQGGGDLREDLTGLIELESGSNDPMAIFLVGAALVLVATPDASLLPFVPQFMTQMGLGAVLGVVIGYALPSLIKRMRLRGSGLSLVVSIGAALLSYGLTAVLGSLGTAGVPGTSIVMLTLTLSTAGLPLEGIGYIIAIDRIIDMMRTATNVTGQMLVPVLVAKEEGLLDEDIYNGHVAWLPGDPDAETPEAVQAAGI